MAGRAHTGRVSWVVGAAVTLERYRGSLRAGEELRQGFLAAEELSGAGRVAGRAGRDDTASMTYDTARQALRAWRDELPADPYSDDRLLGDLLASYLDDDRRAALDVQGAGFARVLTGVIAPRAARYDRRHDPEHVAYDGLGERIDAVEFDPGYHEAGAAVWASRVVAHSGEPGRAFEQATLLLLLSLEGEAGHACPATCTIGLARALRRRASHEVRDRFLPALLDPDYARAARGAQFLTEVQGGSDVGANACVATPDGEQFRISGEKWFCSVADADQFFVTARVAEGPAGTAGIGSFVVPREIDGRPNGFRLRRLKDKLGTRGLASGEIDFTEAVAWPIGDLADGIRTAVGIVLNTSRWMTAVGSAGLARRARREAVAYAHHREAFGRRIEEFGSLRRLLASLCAQADGSLALVMALTDLEDRLDAGATDPEIVAAHRFWVNVAKYLASRQATAAVRDAIEVLGGNGTIEEFSVLPRLYRDAIVYESWEGTHNVLAAQVMNDLRRLELLEPAADLVRRAAAGTPLVAAIEAQMAPALAGLARCRSDAAHAAWHGRDHLDRLGVCAEAALLARAGRVATAQWLLTPLSAGYDAGADAGLADRVDAVLAEAGRPGS